MALNKIEVNIVGANIEVLNVNPVKPNVAEFYALTAIKSVVPVYTENLGTSIVDRAPYVHTDLFVITINFHNESNTPSLRFDLAEVDNQPGWTADFAGLTQAKTDIGGWITSVSPGGGGLPGATEATQQQVLTAIQQHQDFELKLVKDTGAADKIICEVAEYDEQTDTYTYSYKDVGGVAYVVVGPLEYISAEGALNLVLAELVALNAGGQLLTEATFVAEDFATETTLALITPLLTTIDADTSVLATPVTGVVSSLLRVVAAGAASVTAGKRTISFFNAGGADAGVNGSTLKAGETVTYPELSNRDTYAAIAYNALTSELVISTVG